MWVTVHLHTHGTLQFIAEKCASLHSQIFHTRSYHPPMKPSATPFPKSFSPFPTSGLGLGLPLRCPSTSACKHIKPHLTLFTSLCPNCVSHHFHSNVHVDKQHALLQTSNTVYMKKCPVLQCNSGHKLSLALPVIYILEFLFMASLCAAQSFQMLQHGAPVQ